MNCSKCNLPQFDGAAGYVGPQCKCWTHYSPTPTNLQGVGAFPAHALTEQDVRRIVRDELRRAQAAKDTP